MSLSEDEYEDKNIDIESYKLYFEHLSKNDNFIKKSIIRFYKKSWYKC